MPASIRSRLTSGLHRSEFSEFIGNRPRSSVSHFLGLLRVRQVRQPVRQTLPLCTKSFRLWALYLGRPHCIELNDVTIPRPGARVGTQASWEMRMAAAWADIMEIVGYICDAVFVHPLLAVINLANAISNGNHLTVDRVSLLSKRLHNWYSKLDDDLRTGSQTVTSIYVLQYVWPLSGRVLFTLNQTLSMQYYSALILLNRPKAGFGTSSSSSNAHDVPDVTAQSRSSCLQSAVQVANLLQDYEKQHGSASMLSGVALHIISTAATILIAEIADRKGIATTEASETKTIQQYFWCLKRCTTSLSELEKSYLVARRVRKIVQLIMKLCNLGESQQTQYHPTQPDQAQRSSTLTNGAAGSDTSTLITKEEATHPDQFVHDGSQFSKMDVIRDTTPQSLNRDSDLDLPTPVDGTQMPGVPQWDTSWSIDDFYSVDENAPNTSQMDILYSFESFFGNECGA